MTRTQLTSAEYAQVSIDPREMINKLRVQSNEMLRISWQFADNGPEPDEDLQQIVSVSKDLKKKATQALKMWEGAVNDFLTRRRLAPEAKTLPKETYEVIAMVAPKEALDVIAEATATIAGSMVHMEILHRRMMNVVDPEMSRPTPEEQLVLDQQAVELQEERARVKKKEQEDKERIAKAYEEDE